jgi:hypothetical protein
MDERAAQAMPAGVTTYGIAELSIFVACGGVQK